MSPQCRIDEVIEEYRGRSRRVLDYTQITQNMVTAAKHAGADQTWSALADLIDTEEFVRVGNFKEVMNWDAYLGFLNNWAPNAEWSADFRHLTEAGDRVFLELEERSRVGEFDSVVNSLTVFRFNADDKITRIDLFLQMALPDPEMLASYDGVEIAQ